MLQVSKNDDEDHCFLKIFGFSRAADLIIFSENIHLTTRSCKQYITVKKGTYTIIREVLGKLRADHNTKMMELSKFLINPLIIKYARS